MGRLLGIGLWVCVLFAVSPQYAGASRLGDNSGLLTISGNVYYEDGRRPVQNVSVQLRTAAGEMIDTTVTITTGSFEFRGLARQSYSVQVELGGFEPVNLPVDLSSHSCTALEIGLKHKSGEVSSLNANSVSAHELSVPGNARELVDSGKRKLYARKDAAGALRDFRKAVAAAPDYYEAWYQIAMSYLALGKRADEEAALRKSIEVSRDTYGEAEIGLGRSMLERGDVAQAEKMIRRGLELKPDSWVGNYELGRALMGGNRIEEAQKSVEQARALAPTVAIVYELLANIHFRLKDYGGLLQDLNDYIKLDPESAAGRRAKALRAQAIEAIEAQKVTVADGRKP